MSYPPGANYDSRAPWHSSRTKKVNVIVEENEWQFPNDRLNFRVTEEGWDLHDAIGLGATLEEALEDFEDDYVLKHNEAIEMIIVKTKSM